jgi:hypothetical protein
VESITSAEHDAQYHPHPHPQYPFRDIPSGLDNDHSNQGLRFRTVMVKNLPPQLRSEKELKEYFEYYMARRVDKPGLGLTSGMQPGFFNKSTAFLFHRAKRMPNHLPTTSAKGKEKQTDADNIPLIDRVVVVRKMTELASLLQRREEVLRRLETAHIKLARKTIMAVREAVIEKHTTRLAHPRMTSELSMTTLRQNGTGGPDVELGEPKQNDSVKNEERMDLLIRTFAPYVDEFGLSQSGWLVRSGQALAAKSKWAFGRMRPRSDSDSDVESTSNWATRAHPPSSLRPRSKTVWEALLGLPRNTLEPYQPLISLSKLFRGKTVPCVFLCSHMSRSTYNQMKFNRLFYHETQPLDTAYH